ncbi:MAG: hypothetical protein LUC45_01835 [Paraprevotella sp.]|nr:hypothetical protein [Paraprevotella sp.]
MRVSLNLGLSLLSCHNEEKDASHETVFTPEGRYRHEAIRPMNGFEEEKDSLLECCGMSENAFITLSTSPA